MIEIIGKHKAKLIVNIGSGKNRIRRTKTVTYEKKRDLDKLYQKFEAEVTAKPSSKVTVEELVDAYINSKETFGAKATTIKGYRLCKNRLINSLGGFIASEVTPYQIEDFIALSAQKYVSKTIRNTVSLLSAAYKRGVRLGLLAENPCDRITLPKQNQPEIKTLSEEDVVKLLKALEKERLDFKVGYELCLFCGLRRSEVLGLRNSDVNLTFRTVSISRTRHVVDGETKVQDTKTARSRRTLALPDFVCEDIKALIELHDSYEWEHSDFLILTAFGEDMHPSTFSDHLSLIEKENGIPHVSVHGLRHTFATMLNSDGVDIARISAELGHSNIITTSNKYIHVFGNTTSSSRGIADSLNSKYSKSATFLPLSDNEKPLSLENSAVHGGERGI